MFERLRKKRSGNFFSELSWQGYCLLFGASLLISSIFLLFGWWPNGTIGYATPAVGLLLGIGLVVVGVLKR